MIPAQAAVDAMTAFHEAGHAVACHAFGVPVTSVTIDGGACHKQPVPGLPLAAEMIIAASGAHAVGMMWPEQRSLAAASGADDFAHIERLIAEHFADVPNVRQGLMDSTERLLSGRKAAVLGLAVELISRRTVDCEAVRRACEGPLPIESIG